MKFFADYHEAYNYAVREARRRKTEMQLLRGGHVHRYRKTEAYRVSRALKPEYRFGVDAEGEFIKPSDPLIGPSAAS